MASTFIKLPLSGGGGGSSSFTGLSDTPGSYVGEGLKVARVNAGETGIEFAAVSGTGDVVGPASATDNAIARYNLTSGKLLQNSAVTIDDSGNVNTSGTVTASNLTANSLIDHSTVTLTAGAGLSGGGDITTSRAFALDVNSLTTAVGADQLTDEVAVYNQNDAATRKITLSDLQTLIGGGGSGDLLAANNLSDVNSANLSRMNINQGLVTLVDGANISTDADLGNVFEVTLAGNRTLDNPTNLKAGATYIYFVKQDATGSRTLAYGSAFKWYGGVTPVLSTDANAVDIITFVSDGTDMFGSIKRGYA